MKLSSPQISEKRPPADPNTIICAAFQSILDYTPDMMFVKDINLVYAACSLPFAQMVGWHSVDEIVGRTDFDIFADDRLAQRYVADDLKLLTGGKDLIDYIEPLPEKDGRPCYGSTSKYILRDSEGNAIGVLGITRDVTREYFRRQHYQQELQYLFDLPEDTYASVYIDIDDWRIISQRRQLVGGSTMQSCSTVEKLREAALASFIDSGSEAAAFYLNFSPMMLRRIYDSGQTFLSMKYLRRMTDGAVRWVQNNIQFLTDPESGHLCVMLSARDIDAEKREEMDLAVAAKMDKMTMLLNRETTMEYIQQIIAEESDQIHVLFMIDIDNFKSLNDTMGHQAGDEFLIELTREIRKCFRESDIVGRIGGDEFFALMKSIPSFTAAENKAQSLLTAIRIVCARYPTVNLSGSIGISVYPENGRTLPELYAQADTALYKAKKQGKNQFIFAPLL